MSIENIRSSHEEHAAKYKWLLKPNLIELE